MSVVAAMTLANGHIIFGYDHQITDDNLASRDTQGKAFTRYLENTCGDTEVGFGCVGTPATSTMYEHSFGLPAWPALGDNPTISEIDAYVFGLLIPAMAVAERSRVTAWGQEGCNASVLIGILGQLYSMDGYFNAVRLHREYDAIGTGADLALGALDVYGEFDRAEAPIMVMRKCIDIVINRDVNCGGPVGLMRVRCEQLSHENRPHQKVLLTE